GDSLNDSPHRASTREYGIWLHDSAFDEIQRGTIVTEPDYPYNYHDATDKPRQSDRSTLRCNGPELVSHAEHLDQTLTQPAGAPSERAGERPPSKHAHSMAPGLAACIMAIAIGCLAQSELTPLQRLVPSAALFLLASIVAVVGANWIDRCMPLSDPMMRGDTGTWRDSKRHPAGRNAAGIV